MYFENVKWGRLRLLGSGYVTGLVQNWISSLYCVVVEALSMMVVDVREEVT